MIKQRIFYVFLILTVSNCKLLLWSSKKLNLPALKLYNTEGFREVIRELGNPIIAVFNVDFSQVPTSVLRNELHLYSSYLPNADVNFTEFKVIEHNNDVSIIKEMCSIYVDPLIIFEGKRERMKRATTTQSAGILYEDQGAMIYTRRPPVLRKDLTFFVLKQCRSVTTDIRVNTVQITLEFEVSNNVTIGVIFLLVFLNNEWVLATTKLSDVYGDIYLTTGIKIHMPEKFSYHCTYDIRFRDVDNDVEVLFYGMQIQPFCKEEKFSATVECKTYVTPGIVSAWVVCVLFGTALYIGLSGLCSIKTMDKFDTGKISQLHLDDITR